MGVPSVERDLGKPAFTAGHAESAARPHLFSPEFAHVETRPLLIPRLNPDTLVM